MAIPDGEFRRGIDGRDQRAGRLSRHLRRLARFDEAGGTPPLLDHGPEDRAAVARFNRALTCCAYASGMTLDPSFEPDPDLGGSYHRRLQDIPCALTKFEVTALPPNSPAQFVAYYFGAEKLAKAIAGILCRVAAEKAFEGVPVKPAKIKSAVEPMGLHISDTAIDALFVRNKDTKQPDTAIEIRNRLFHDFGPTQVRHVRKHAERLIPIMVSFIRDDIDNVLRHLRALWAASQSARP